jgi:RNA polymerase sigma-70 factor (ECF subfamily)
MSSSYHNKESDKNMNISLTAYHQTKEQISQENDLVAQAQKDTSHFAVLYKRYYQQIFLFALKRVESEDTAADVTQQVFLKALINLPKYRNVGLPFSSWLFRIARNEMYDMFRRNKVQMVVSIDKDGIGEIIAEIGEEPGHDHTALHSALGSLTDEEMELIELRYFEKRPFKELSEILSITENYAKVKTYRILDKLKEKLKNER